MDFDGLLSDSERCFAQCRRAEPVVVTRLQAGTGKAVLSVDDDGPGISPEAVDNLFTPFFSTKPHGQGIGLTLVQEVLPAHGFEYGLERLD